MMRVLVYRLVLVIGVFLLVDCRKDKALIDLGGYPNDIGKIMVYKCATSGCHNSASYLAAAGLDLTSWETMFNGSNAGSSVIPFRSDLSSLCYFINTYPEYGPINVPTMPYNKGVLTKTEVKAVKDWIDAGAPNLSGFVKWSDNPNRKKAYVINQGCDLVTVFDSETNLPMRCINVGKDPNTIESPHMIKVSPDGQFWYIVFTNSNVMQKYRCSDDVLVGEATLGLFFDWNTLVLSSDGTRGYCVSWASNGVIASVDLNQMKAININPGYFFPHGCALNGTNDTLYVTGQTGNYIMKIDTSLATTQTLSLQNGLPPSTASSLNPHEILLSPDKNSLYVTCEDGNDLRVFSIASQSVTNIINCGTEPEEMSVSVSKNLLFVTNVKDAISFPGGYGSVSVIDLTTYTEIKRLQVGFTPHGIAVDENKGLVYVVSRNVLSSGPVPHHSSACAGRNGFVSFIDLNTLTVKSKRTEVSVDPYGVDVRK